VRRLLKPTRRRPIVPSKQSAEKEGKMGLPIARTVIVAVILVGGAGGLAQAASDAGSIRYSNCTALHKRWPHGVGRWGARDHTSGTPVTTFKRSNLLYRQNSHLDRDKDGIACEKR
jgi:hypothetical protein